jgi:hypothetical protein
MEDDCEQELSESGRVPHGTAMPGRGEGVILFRDSRVDFIDNLDNWNGGVARTYRCHHCGWFHLTSKRIYWESRRLAEEAA